MRLGVREYIVVPPGQTPSPAAASLALPVDLPAPGAPWTKPAVQGALWVITDRRPIPSDASSAASLCQMARQGCSGIYADFERPPGNAACRFLAALQAGLSQLRLPLLVPAAYASLLPGAACVLTWQPGDGAFSAAAAGRLWKARRPGVLFGPCPGMLPRPAGQVCAAGASFARSAGRSADRACILQRAPGLLLQADPYRRRPPLHPFRHRRVFSSAPQPSRAPAPDRPLASAARIGRALQCPRF